jgi:hypothetical protein
MCYFENPNFIAQLIKGQGACNYFTNSNILPMLVYVEM